MTTINDLDLGPSHSWPRTRVGQLIGSAAVEGSRTVTWARAGVAEEQAVELYLAPWQGVGGAAAGTRAALLYMLRQLEELASNPDAQPVYIGWTTSAASGALNVADSHDGWYVLNVIDVPYRPATVSGGTVTIPATVAKVAPAAPSPLSLWWPGATLSSGFVTAATPLVAFPVGASQALPTSWTRTGGEGAIPVNAIATSAQNPLPFVSPGAAAGLYTGGCRVYDTVNTGSNPVPTAGGFVHANWVQVYGPSHDFVGDCVLTNGLQLLLFQAGQAQLAQVYLWNTQLGPPAWQNWATLKYSDATLRYYALDRVGLEEVRLRTTSSPSTGVYGQVTVRLQRGRYEVPLDLVQAATTSALVLQFPASLKAIFQPSGATDAQVGAGSLGTDSALGYSGAFVNSSSFPFVGGWLYQATPTNQGAVGASASQLAIGDNSGTTGRTFALWAIPFPTPQNLQAEAEGGTLGTGWSSVADGAASGGNTAKAASGTASGNADLFGTSWVLPSGSFDTWFRVRVTSAGGSASEMTLGLWDATSSAFVASTSWRANQASTSYVWLQATTNSTPTAGHSVRFRAVTAATLGTDWFIDEAILAPRSLTPADGPANLWPQFAYATSPRLVRG